MNALTLAKKIINQDYVLSPSGTKKPLHSNIDIEELDFITKIIQENQYSSSIEIGCAYGLSSLAIAGALNNHNRKQIIIDPYQSTDWEKIGIQNLEKAGCKDYNLIEEKSEIALPKELANGIKIDFGFIDGWHTFDHTLIDFFYLNRMLKVGGTIIIDDCSMPSIRQLVRFLANYPCYEVIDRVKEKETTATRIFQALLSPVGIIAKLILPKKVQEPIFNPAFLWSDKSRGLDGSMIAFKKISEDARPWNWHESF